MGSAQSGLKEDHFNDNAHGEVGGSNAISAILDILYTRYTRGVLPTVSQNDLHQYESKLKLYKSEACDEALPV